MKTIAEIKEFILTRIQEVENKTTQNKMEKRSGLLLHFIPETIIDTSVSQPIDCKLSNHQFIIKHGFRRFSDLHTIYTDKQDKIEGYTPEWKYFNCFQNGIIEGFRGRVEVENWSFNFVKVDNLFYTVRDFLEISLELHKKIYHT